MRWTAEEPWFYSRQITYIFLPYKMFRPASGST
jgi:hypothetical protein